jgi:ABC-type bacteriocin/lantibiotic exporter with double-glycine peptidase domain
MDKLTPVTRLFRLLKLDQKDITYIYIYAVFSGLITLAIPLGFQAIIGLMVAGSLSSTWWILVALVVIGTSLPGVLKVMQLTVTETLVRRIFARSAFDIAYRLPNLKAESIMSRYAPEMVNRFFDTLTIQKGLPKLLMDFSTALLQIFFGLLLLSFYHPFFVFFSVTLLILLAAIFWFTSPYGLKTSIQESSNKYQVAYWLEELARAQSSFQSTGIDAFPLAQTDEKVSQYLDARKKHFRVLLTQYHMIVAFKALITVALLVLGGMLVIDNQLSIGQFVAAEIVVILIMQSAEKLIMGMETVYDVLTALDKLGELSDLPIEDVKGNGRYKIDTIETIEIKDLSYVFKDTGRTSLKNINLSIQPGQKICITGASGSGKSTLLKILAATVTGYNGQILINGIPFKNLNLNTWRRLSGVVSTQSDIFRGTILDNINMGNTNIRMENITEIARNIGLDQFLQNSPEGYETALLPDGRNVPRSIRTKILLARSLANRPEILLYEDFLAHLEPTDRIKIIKYLTSTAQRATALAISDDPIVARASDRVIVLSQGEVIADARWEELPDDMKLLFLPPNSEPS